MTFKIPVRSEISQDEYKTLLVVAAAHNTTVGALVAELVHRGLTNATKPQKRTPKKRGAQIKLTPAQQAAVPRMTRGGYNDKEISDFFKVSAYTVMTVRREADIISRRGKRGALELERRAPIEELAHPCTRIT